MLCKAGKTGTAILRDERKLTAVELKEALELFQVEVEADLAM